MHDQLITGRTNQPSGVTALAVVPEGGSSEEFVLITACDDKALKLWKMPNFDKRGILAQREGHAENVHCLARGPGNSFFSGSQDRTVLVWEFI